MVATLFYVDALPDTGALAVVGGDEGFHAATVRRIRPGEQLVLGDGAGGVRSPDRRPGNPVVRTSRRLTACCPLRR